MEECAVTLDNTLTLQFPALEAEKKVSIHFEFSRKLFIHLLRPSRLNESTCLKDLLEIKVGIANPEDRTFYAIS